jgi:hypothetical protein
MIPKVPSRLLREWAALIAVLAMALGPLALAASRSLGAAERIAVSSGAPPLTLCFPGGTGEEGDRHSGAADCDHCAPVQPFALSAAESDIFPSPAAATAGATGTTLQVAAFPRAPPARGPPAA